MLPAAVVPESDLNDRVSAGLIIQFGLLLTILWSCTTGDSVRPRSRSSGTAENAALSPNRLLADQGDLVPFGDIDLADLFLSVTAGAVFRRDSRGLGIVGGARGVMNLSLGFIVCIWPVIALSDALLSRTGLTSVGTLITLTGCPGRYGHEVVDGSDELCISVPSLSSYFSWSVICQR